MIAFQISQNKVDQTTDFACSTDVSNVSPSNVYFLFGLPWWDDFGSI